MFGNIETLLGVNTQLLASLEARVSENSGNGQVVLGDIFLNMVRGIPSRSLQYHSFLTTTFYSFSHTT